MRVSRGALGVAVAGAIAAAGCLMAGSRPDEAEEDPQLTTRETPQYDPTVGTSTRTDPAQEAVGWVNVLSSDRAVYEVYQEGTQRGYTAVRLTQRPGNASYETRDESGRALCRGTVAVERYEEVCLECDVRTGKFRRAPC